MLIQDMQLLSDWEQPGNVGDDGGASSVPNGKFTMVPGSPARFVAAGAFPYNNGYFYRNVPEAPNTSTYFEYSFNLTFPTQADIDACQAFEFELQQNVGAAIYNMAYQFSKTAVSTFDYNHDEWVATTIPLPTFVPGIAHYIAACFLRQNASLTHLGININNIWTALNITRPATPKVESDYVHASIQLDSASPAAPYLVQIDKMNLLMLDTVG